MSSDQRRENGIGLWEFEVGSNCTDWVAAASEEEATAYYERETGADIGDCTVTEIADLDDRLFSILDSEPTIGADGHPVYPKVSARAIIAEGGPFPRVTASTEY